ncbi:MAG: hypothetical protein IKK75_15510 [Clostridia bacterium]|nr:hypothetical protein [Clostridia bacterium]
MPQPVCKPYPGSRYGRWIGYALLAIGIVVLFVCIPGWAWAALLGVLLIAAGLAVLKLSNAWR